MQLMVSYWQPGTTHLQSLPCSPDITPCQWFTHVPKSPQRLRTFAHATLLMAQQTMQPPHLKHLDWVAPCHADREGTITFRLFHSAV